VVCYFYPPLAGGGVYRVLGFTRHLPNHGWDCTVVTAGPHDFWVTDASLEAAVPAATEVVRVTGGSGLSAWRRWRRAPANTRPGTPLLRALSDWVLLPDSYVGWARRASSVTRRLLAEGRFDAVLTSSPPDSVHLVGLATRGRSSPPWVADFRDPWMGLRLRRPPTAWHRARQERLERDVLTRADAVLAASRTHADDVAARLRAWGLDPAKVDHLPNGYEPADVAGAAGAEPTAASGSGGSGAGPDAFLLAFTGIMALMPDGEVFLEAVHDFLARRPEARRRLRARLVGPHDPSYADRAVALGLKGIVEYTGPRPHAEARALQGRAHVLMLWQPRDFPTMVPGKLYEYAEARRPIVAILDPATESAELVRRAGGVVVPVGDRRALELELERRYDAWREGRSVALERPAWLDEHLRSALAARLARRLERLTQARA
jgi:glycosyl transferase family 4